MPRAARIVVPGWPHHVIQRGHNKADTFFTPGDRELYLGLLDEYVAKRGCDLHAYALMSNHVHLLVTPPEDHALAELMAAVNQRYVQSVNRRRSRCGSIWQGRFHSCVVDTDRYFLTCQRYIEL